MGIKGADAHLKRLRAISGPAMQREAGKLVYTLADRHATEAALSITAGAVSGKNHVASLPGEAPNADTHLLDRSIHAEKTGPLTAQSVADAPYAAALEGGSKREAGKAARSFAGKTTPYGPNKAKQGPVLMEFGSSKTAARPFMRPAATKIRKDAGKLAKAAVARILKGGAV